MAVLLSFPSARLPAILALGLTACRGPSQPAPTSPAPQPSGATLPHSAQQQLEARAGGGELQACFELGLQYDKREEYGKASKWYEKAAAGGLARAWFNLGVMYELGQGVTQHFGQAAFHYRQATIKGNLPRAWHNLGLLFAEGKPGLPKNSKTAMDHYLKAADQNYTLAQRAVAHAYARGEGADQDLVQAVKWYKRAAELNDPEAQYDLGLCYASSRGVEKDLVEAYKWINIAAAHVGGHLQAVEARKLLEQSMTAMEIQEAQARAQQWLDARDQSSPPNN